MYIVRIHNSLNIKNNYTACLVRRCALFLGNSTNRSNTIVHIDALLSFSSNGSYTGTCTGKDTPHNLRLIINGFTDLFFGPFTATLNAV